MSLDVSKLEKVRQLASGMIQAQCPACAEGGGDRKGQHLRIYPDGRFGCCVFPKDGEHRKRIFALVGFHQPKPFTVRIKTPPAMPAARSVKAVLAAFDVGTLGTPTTESEKGVSDFAHLSVDSSGTLGTANFKLRTYEREELPTVLDTNVEKLKDLETSVPSVPAAEWLPFLTAGGD